MAVAVGLAGQIAGQVIAVVLAVGTRLSPRLSRLYPRRRFRVTDRRQPSRLVSYLLLYREDADWQRKGEYNLLDTFRR